MASLFRTSFALPPLDQPDLPPSMSEILGPSDRPLALLPVRLETRFFAVPGEGNELCIRIYPDKFHVYSHEAALTADEQQWGKHYWEQDWRAGDDDKPRRDAWRQIEVRFGRERAEWVARRLSPQNADQRPQSPTKPGQPLDPKPKFPVIAVAEGDEERTRIYIVKIHSKSKNSFTTPASLVARTTSSSLSTSRRRAITEEISI